MGEPSHQSDEAAIAASATCTRAGAFCLVLSLALFTMIPYWVHRGEQISLVNYVTLRLSLAGAIETLDGSVNWKTYRASNPEAESMTIAQLLKVQVHGGPMSPPYAIVQKAPEANQGVAKIPPGAPAPPTNVQVSTSSTIYEIGVIGDLLSKLDDSRLLTESRNVSIFYNYSIFRWAIKRQNLLSRNIGASSGGVVFEAAPDPNAPNNYVSSWGKDLVLNNLTVKDARELASFELPQLSDTTSIGVTGEREIDISPGSLPRTLFSATLCAESLLLFLIVYFGVFVREAASSESFPVPGTVFSAFARSGWTLVVFGIALCVPVIASLGILLISRKWEFLLLAVLISCAVCWNFLVLQEKHYFGNFGWISHIAKGLLTSKREMLFIVGCNHGIQVGTGGFAALDGVAASEQREHYRAMLESICARNRVDSIFEENGAPEETGAKQLAVRLGVLWSDINTSNEDKQNMGIPPDYLTGPYTAEEKAQWNRRREEFMATRIKAQRRDAKSSLVICGFDHLEALADLLRQGGTIVRKLDYRSLSWYRPGVFTEDP